MMDSVPICLVERPGNIGVLQVSQMNPAIDAWCQVVEMLAKWASSSAQYVNIRKELVVSNAVSMWALVSS